MVSLSAIELYKYPHPQPKRGLQELQYAARSVSGVQKDYILNTQPNPKQSTDLKSWLIARSTDRNLRRLAIPRHGYGTQDVRMRVRQL